MYKRFSDFYDQLVFDIDYDKYAKNIFQILESYNIKKGNILEIGCGTGNLTRELAKKEDFNIHAFDISHEMLNHAFTKLIDYDNIQVFIYDMFSFPYEDYEYEAIVSLLDVMNYIRNPKQLESLFEKIYKGLGQGGLFIFDLNSRYKLLEVLGNNSYVYEKDNIFYTWENQLVDDEVFFNLNFFIEEDDLYERFTEYQVERYYSIEFISNLLKKIGFKDINYIDEDGGPYKENKTQRILFSAKK